MTTIDRPGIYDIPNDVYHANPALSSTGTRRMLSPYCPAIFDHQRRNPVFKDEFDFGSAAHRQVLGDMTAELVIFDSPDWKKRADQVARKEAREAGKIPVLRKQVEEVTAMAEVIKAHPIASRLFHPGSGKPEQSIFWEDEHTGVMLRVRPDWLPNKVTGRRFVLPDYKTANSAEPFKFAKSAADFGYHQQAALYIDGIKAVGLDDDPAFLFVVQEREAPYLVTVVELDEEALHIGRNLNRIAINTYAECLRTGIWPGYSNDIELVSLPAWYAKQHDEGQAA